MALSEYKLSSIPSDLSFNNIYSYGPDRSDISYFSANISGNDYYFVPSDVLKQGVVVGLGENAWGAPSTYYYPKALSDSFQQEIKNSGTYADLSNIPYPDGNGTFGYRLQRAGRSPTGFFIPVNDTTTNVLQNPQVTGVGPNNTSAVLGVINAPEKGIAYRTINTLGHELGFTTPDGQTWGWDKPTKSSFQKFVENLGPLPVLATAIFAPQYLPLVSGAQTAIQGGDIEDILESAAKSYVLQQVGKEFGSYGDQAATAAQYGTDLGSAQTAMLAAQEAGLGTVADVAGNVIGQVGTSVVSPTITGRDTNPLDVLLSSGVSAATPFVTSQIEGFSDLPIRAQNAINTIVASEMTGRDPTNAVIAEAVRAGKDAYNNESRAIAGGWDSYAQLQDAASLGIGSKDAYLAYQQGAPVDDGTTAGVKEIVEQTQTGPKDDGTAAGIQDIIDQIQSAPESGIQVAGPLPTDVFNVDVGGSPIYGDTSRANTVKPPFGYGLLPISMADQKPEGSYYDVTQNAWFMPTDEVQRLQDQLTGSDQTSTPPILEGGDLGESGSVDTSGGSLGDESDLGPEPTGTTGWQGPMGPMTEEQTKRYTDEFSKYLDSLQGGATIPPNYGVQDLGITQENWQSFDRNLQQMQEEGRLPTQWKPGDNGTFTYTDDDGSTLTIDENGNIIGYTETPVGNLPGETPTGGPNTAGPSMGGATTGATTGGNTPTTKPPTTPATPATPLTPAVQPAAKTDSSSNLLALLALADRPVQQQPQPVPLADIKYYYDFGDDLVPEKPQNTQNMPARFEFFDGGEVEDLSVDDLIRMLQGD